MKERPIAFGTDQVRAILDGRKTQTRRPVSPDRGIKLYKGAFDARRVLGNPENRAHQRDDGVWCIYTGRYNVVLAELACPYGVPGDRLWVRETFLQPLANTQMPSGEYESYWTGWKEDIRYVADGAVEEWTRVTDDGVPYYGSPWRAKRPSIHMPRWASRITLEVKSVRIERAQAISDQDAMAEGYASRDDFVQNSKWCRKHWDANPFVWVVGFERVEATP